MIPPIPPEASREIELVKGLVARHFPVYDVRVNFDVVEFYCRVDPATLEEEFEQLRHDMVERNYVPMIVYDKGEHIVTVAKRPSTKHRSVYVNVAMMAVTLLTLLIAGAVGWAGYADVPVSELFYPETLAMGFITFSLPLMSILAVHELGHYVMARRRRVRASLPFFIPFLPPLGTLGAFIALRDPIPNKKTLLDIGVAGPLAGLAMTLPIGVIGLILTNQEARLVPQNMDGSMIGVSLPLIYIWLEQFVPIQGDYLMHPTAFAAWVGFLVTALNLLPMGQLDGGHIARALFGSRTKYISWITALALIVMGFLVYMGWLVLALLVIFLGVRHPPPLNDLTRLDLRRKSVGIAAMAVLVIAFVPIPWFQITPDYTFEMTPLDHTNATMAPGESRVFTARIDNVGNALNEINLTKGASPVGWSILYKRTSESDTYYAEQYTLRLNSEESATVDIRVVSPISSESGDNMSVVARAYSTNDSIERTITYNFTLTSPVFEFQVEEDEIIDIPRGANATMKVYVNSTSKSTIDLKLSAKVGQVGFVDVLLIANGTDEDSASSVLELTVHPSDKSHFFVSINVSDEADTGRETVAIEVSYKGVLIFTIFIPVSIS